MHLVNELFQKKPKMKGLRTWNLQGVSTKQPVEIHVLVKKEVQFPEVIKKGNVKF